MAFPDDPIGNQWTDAEALDASLLHDRIDVPLDALRAAAKPTAVKRATASGASITVADSTTYLLGYYNGGVTYDNDPHSLISYASGVFTVAVGGLWGWSISFSWPSVASGTVPHHRDLFAFRGGAALGDGRNAVPWPVAPGAGWPAVSAQTQGHAICSAGDTLQAGMYQTSGADLIGTGATFTVWLADL